MPIALSSRKGRRVKSIADLISLANDGRSVVYGPNNIRVPAAFLQNWPARVLHNTIIGYGVWVYYKNNQWLKECKRESRPAL